MTTFSDADLARNAQRMRAEYDRAAVAAGPPDDVAEVRPLAIPRPGGGTDLAARLYVPRDAADAPALPLVLFAHGGGFVSGTLDTHDVLVRAIANGAGALVLSVDYRLAPEHPYPAGVEDLYTALVWAAAHAEEIGADPSRIALAGDSAGGNLAAAVTMLARDRGGPVIVAQWLMYATLSNKMDTGSWDEWGDTRFPTKSINAMVTAAYVPKGMSVTDPAVAPLWGTHHDLPPALLQVGSMDPLRDENIAYAEALNGTGGEAMVTVSPGDGHGFLQFFKERRGNPGGEQALQEGLRFLRREFSR